MDKQKDHVLGYSDDGTIEYRMLTAEYLERSLEVMRKSFFIYENASIAVELPNYPQAIQELEELTLFIARDGISVIAVEKCSGIVAGVAFNKIRVAPCPGEEDYFERYAASCTEPSSKAFVQFMIDADATFDLFEHLHTECLVEVMFVSTLSAFQGRGTGLRLTELSIELAQRLRNGEAVRVPITEKPLLEYPRPSAVSAFCTSTVTQGMCRTLGCSTPITIDYKRWQFNGKTFAERIGPETPYMSINYLLLK